MLLNAHGRGDSEFSVLEQLGGPDERRRDGTAREWADERARQTIDDLNVVAVRYLPDERMSSLPDDAFAHDGQITKHGIRAVTLAALAPRPGRAACGTSGRARAVSPSSGAAVGEIAARWRSNATSGAASTSTYNAVAFGVGIDVRGEAPKRSTAPSRRRRSSSAGA